MLFFSASGHSLQKKNNQYFCCKTGCNKILSRTLGATRREKNQYLLLDQMTKHDLHSELKQKKKQTKHQTKLH